MNFHPPDCRKHISTAACCYVPLTRPRFGTMTGLIRIGSSLLQWRHMSITSCQIRSNSTACLAVCVINKESSKLSIDGPYLRESTNHWWTPLTSKRQQCGKCVNVLTSLCSIHFVCIRFLCFCSSTAGNTSWGSNLLGMAADCIWPWWICDEYTCTSPGTGTGPNASSGRRYVINPPCTGLIYGTWMWSSLWLRMAPNSTRPANNTDRNTWPRTPKYAIGWQLFKTMEMAMNSTASSRPQGLHSPWGPKGDKELVINYCTDGWLLGVLLTPRTSLSNSLHAPSVALPEVANPVLTNSRNIAQNCSNSTYILCRASLSSFVHAPSVALRDVPNPVLTKSIKTAQNCSNSTYILCRPSLSKFLHAPSVALLDVANPVLTNSRKKLQQQHLYFM